MKPALTHVRQVRQGVCEKLKREERKKKRHENHIAVSFTALFDGTAAVAAVATAAAAVNNGGKMKVHTNSSHFDAFQFRSLTAIKTAYTK